MSVGFIGLGNMGQPMALNLLKAGFQVVVYDLNKQRVDLLVEWGARAASSLSEVVTPGGIVIDMLPNDETVLDVASQSNGILRALGGGGIHLSLGTTSLAVVQQLTPLYAQHGNAFLSGTVLGRPDLAAQANLSILLSGDRKAKTRVRPLLEQLGTLYDLEVSVEAATIAKLAANFMILAAIETMGEAATLVERYGVSRSLFLHIMAQTPLFQGTVFAEYGRMIGAQDFTEALFPVGLGLKDVRLILQAAQQVGLLLPIAQVGFDHLLAAQDDGRGHEDWSVLANYATKVVAV